MTDSTANLTDQEYPDLPRDLFESAYAERSGLTVAGLHHAGRWGELCYCDEAGCEGWAMGNQHAEAILEDEQRAASAPFVIDKVMSTRNREAAEFANDSGLS